MTKKIIHSASWDTYSDCYGLDDEGVPIGPLGRRLGKQGGGIDWVYPNRKNKTKSQEPYAYSEFYIWRDGRLKDSSAVYSDRLQQWSQEDWDRAWDSLSEKKRFNQFTRNDATKFLCAYFQKEVVATGLVEGCNVSNGYPYWVFFFKDSAA